MKFKATEPFVVDNTRSPAGSCIHRMSDDGTWN